MSGPPRRNVLSTARDLTGSRPSKRPFSAAASSAPEELSPCVVAICFRESGTRRAPENHSLVCGWRAQSPFCWRRLQRLCQQYATIFVDATSIVVEAGSNACFRAPLRDVDGPAKHVSFWSKMV